MFSQIEVDKFYHQRELEETRKKQIQYHPRVYMGNSKYDENWYQQVRILYPKKNILDKLKQKREIYAYRSLNTSRMKSSIHGTPRSVNMDSYFNDYTINDDQKLSNYQQQIKFTHKTILQDIIIKQRLKSPLDQEIQTDQLRKRPFNSYFEIKSTRNSSRNCQRDISIDEQNNQNIIKVLNISRKVSQQQSENNQIAATTFPVIESINEQHHPKDQNDLKMIKIVVPQSARGADQMTDSDKSGMFLTNLNSQRDIIKQEGRNYRKSMSMLEEYSDQRDNKSTKLNKQLKYLNKTIDQKDTQKPDDPKEQKEQKSILEQLLVKKKKKIQNEKGKTQNSEYNNKDCKKKVTLQEKIKCIFGESKEIESRLLDMLEADNIISNTLLILMQNSLEDSARMLTTFFLFCLQTMFEKEEQLFKDEQSNKEILSSNDNSKINKVDIEQFKNLRISRDMVDQFEHFFSQEMVRGELKNEFHQFPIVFTSLSMSHLVVDDFLVQIGGYLRLDGLVSSLVSSLNKSYGITLIPHQSNAIYTLAHAILSGRKHEETVRQQIKQYMMLMKDFSDLYIIKQAIFSILCSVDDISWDQKLSFMERLEHFRMEYFKDLYNIPANNQIVDSMKILCPKSFKLTLPFKTDDSLSDFFLKLAHCLIGGGNTQEFAQLLIKEQVEPTHNTLIFLEYLLKSSLQASNVSDPKLDLANNMPHQLQTSLWLLKGPSTHIQQCISFKFILVRRHLKLLPSLSYIVNQSQKIIQKIDEITPNLLKYMKIPENKHNQYYENSSFYQLLIESCSDHDVFFPQDLNFALLLKNVSTKCFLFWVKALQRVLLLLQFPASQTQIIVAHVLKIYNEVSIS